MSKIVEYSNWGYWDQLDGEILKAGEKLIVTYPDGSETSVTVQIDDHSFTSSDMGNPFLCAKMISFAEYDFHGAKVRLQLRGMEARRV